jgi:hypothetical protein
MITKIETISEDALVYAVNKFLGAAHPARGVLSVAKDDKLFAETVERAAIKHSIHFIQHFKNGGGVAFCYEHPVNNIANSWSFKNAHTGFNRFVAVSRVALFIRFGAEVDLPDCFNEHGELVLDANGEVALEASGLPLTEPLVAVEEF